MQWIGYLFLVLFSLGWLDIIGKEYTWWYLMVHLNG